MSACKYLKEKLDFLQFEIDYDKHYKQYPIREHKPTFNQYCDYAWYNSLKILDKKDRIEFRKDCQSKLNDFLPILDELKLDNNIVYQRMKQWSLDEKMNIVEFTRPEILQFVQDLKEHKDVAKITPIINWLLHTRLYDEDDRNSGIHIKPMIWMSTLGRASETTHMFSADLTPSIEIWLYEKFGKIDRSTYKIKFIADLTVPIIKW